MLGSAVSHVHIKDLRRTTNGWEHVLTGEGNFPLREQLRSLAVYERRPVDLRMPLVNVVWQGDANSWCLRSFAHCQSPPFVLNITGPETLSVREIAFAFGRHFAVEPQFSSEPAASALLNNAAKARQLFGETTVKPAEMIEWTANWIKQGGATLGKPTHFQTRDGKF